MLPCRHLATDLITFCYINAARACQSHSSFWQRPEKAVWYVTDELSLAVMKSCIDCAFFILLLVFVPHQHPQRTLGGQQDTGDGRIRDGKINTLRMFMPE